MWTVFDISLSVLSPVVSLGGIAAPPGRETRSESIVGSFSSKGGGGGETNDFCDSKPMLTNEVRAGFAARLR